jgi:hypothetical protein
MAKKAPQQGKVIDRLARSLLARFLLTEVEVRKNDCLESRAVAREAEDFAGNFKGIQKS